MEVWLTVVAADIEPHDRLRDLRPESFVIEPFIDELSGAYAVFGFRIRQVS